MGFNVSINNGTVTTRSADDGVNASFDDGLADQNATPSITINGGTVKVYADADGLDSNGDLIITGGTVVGIGSGGYAADSYGWAGVGSAECEGEGPGSGEGY